MYYSTFSFSLFLSFSLSDSSCSHCFTVATVPFHVYNRTIKFKWKNSIALEKKTKQMALLFFVHLIRIFTYFAHYSMLIFQLNIFFHTKNLQLFIQSSSSSGLCHTACTITPKWRGKNEWKKQQKKIHLKNGKNATQLRIKLKWMNVSFIFEMIEEQHAQVQVQQYHLNRIFNVVFPYFASSIYSLARSLSQTTN